MFSNRLDDLVNSFNKEDVIYHRQIKNATSPQLLGIRRNRVADYSKIEKWALGKNRVTSHSKIEEGVTERNKVINHFEIEEKIESANGNMSKVGFFY